MDWGSKWAEVLTQDEGTYLLGSISMIDSVKETMGGHSFEHLFRESTTPGGRGRLREVNRNEVRPFNCSEAYRSMIVRLK